MDKRTLLFILLIGAAFFGINYYFSTPTAAPKTIKKAAPPQKQEQQAQERTGPFYVLQNGYQQLVFSTTGGSLAEINLSLQDKEDEKSVVRPIGFDRQMEKEAPYNDYFPAKPYIAAGNVRHEKGELGGFYPLIRRDLVSAPNGKTIAIDPKNYALNLVSDYPELASLSYEVKEFDEKHIVFEGKQEHRKITKTYSFGDAPYMIDLKIAIEGDNRGLFLTSGVPEVELLSGSFAPSLKYSMMRQEKSDVEVIDLPKEKDAISASSINPTWLSNTNSYFGLIFNPVSEMGSGYRVQFVSGLNAPTRLGALDPEYKPYKIADYPGYNALLPLSPQASVTELHFYAGPLDDAILKQADPAFLGAQNFQGWFSFISEPFAKFLYVLMKFFYMVTSSWAASIVLLTLALRVMLYPLNQWSFKSMRRMQELSPQVALIQERYKKDQKKAQMEIMNLYRSKQVNPFTGCLPILIQMPFLIGMFDLLKSTFALRGASFIPGWIDNLTAPDVLFSWSYPIPFIGTQFHLLPILLGAVMFLQQRMSATGPKDVNKMTDQQRQQRFMGHIMVIFFTVMFYNFPSGLNLYWLSSMLLGILQQWWTNRSLDKNKGKAVLVK